MIRTLTRTFTRSFASAVLVLLVASPASSNSLETQDSVEQTTSTTPSVPMTAEMVKRGDGTWVISKLRATDDLQAREIALDDHPDLQATFERYRRAMSRGDMTQLSSVWIMNPAERADMDRLARADKRFFVSISDASVNVDGDRATVSFMQARTQSIDPAPRKRTLSRRGMAAFDSAGSWDNVTTR